MSIGKTDLALRAPRWAGGADATRNGWAQPPNPTLRHDKGTRVSHRCHATDLGSVTPMANNRHIRASFLSLMAASFGVFPAFAADPEDGHAIVTEPSTTTGSVQVAAAEEVAVNEAQSADVTQSAQGAELPPDFAPGAAGEPAIAPRQATGHGVRPAFDSTPLQPHPTDHPEKKPEWYETLKLRGYTQVRYNRLPTFDSNEALVNDQGDKYIGAGSGFGIRRARVIIYGDVHPQVGVYLQTDFASAIGDQNHVAIVRDWYADIAVDKERTLRFRVGQSKVPFGFENLQSSQNRLAFDRNDAINSAVKDERDLGVFAYWAPTEIRARFKELVDSNLKGSGDYGVVGLGVYNGQTANRFDRNDNLHVVGRVSYPFKIGEQFLELGIGGYTGLYTIKTQDPEEGPAYDVRDADGNLRDARALASVTLYPQPFGFQAEYNIGKGPQQLADDPTTIATDDLSGGYAQVMFKIDEPLGTVSLIPYVRGTLYEGGKKFETNTPLYDIQELEMGAEWQLAKALELTLAYTLADRTSSKPPYAQQQGHIFRVQAQVNY